MPSQEILEEYYSDKYFMADFARNNNLLESASNKQNSEQAKEFDNLISNYVSKNKSKVSVTEIGCSWGYLLWNLKKFGYSVKGFELSQTTAKEGSHQLDIDITPGFFEPQPETFDVVILRHVLEHVNNPKDLLSQIYISLKEGGIFILEGPNLDSISSRLFGQNVSWVAPPEHVSYPKFKPILMANSNIGFECVHVSTRRGRGISLFHQSLLNIVAAFYGGKDNAKSTLGGINETASNKKVNLAKQLALQGVRSFDTLFYPVNFLFKKLLLEEEMLIVFRK
jgi:SAM-dependent methyltransferase